MKIICTENELENIKELCAEINLDDRCNSCVFLDCCGYGKISDSDFPIEEYCEVEK